MNSSYINIKRRIVMASGEIMKAVYDMLIVANTYSGGGEYATVYYASSWENYNTGMLLRF